MFEAIIAFSGFMTYVLGNLLLGQFFVNNNFNLQTLVNQIFGITTG